MAIREKYIAVLITFINKDFIWREVCLDVRPFPPPRRGPNYASIIKSIIGDAGLELTDIFAAVSDHEGAIRSWFRLCGFCTIGCGCHFFRLAPPKMCPPLKEIQVQEVADAEAAAAAAALLEAPVVPGDPVDDSMGVADVVQSSDSDDDSLSRPVRRTQNVPAKSLTSPTRTSVGDFRNITRICSELAGAWSSITNIGRQVLRN